MNSKTSKVFRCSRSVWNFFYWISRSKCRLQYGWRHFSRAFFIHFILSKAGHSRNFRHSICGQNICGIFALRKKWLGKFSQRWMPSEKTFSALSLQNVFLSRSFIDLCFQIKTCRYQYAIRIHRSIYFIGRSIC